MEAALWSIKLPRERRDICMMEVECSSLDRISTLPEDITVCILCLMPIRDAVRTSILSRKWRYIWASIPKLIIDNRLFRRPRSLFEDDDSQAVKLKLANAIFHLLMLRTSPLIRFTWIMYLNMPFEIDQIILYLSRSNTLERFALVNKSIYNHCKLPYSLASLQKLKHLELSNFELEPSKIYNGFSMLRRLVLYDVKITTNSLRRFLTNCPLLDELYLFTNQRRMWKVDKITFDELFISLPLLQSLAISKDYMEHFATSDMPRELPISLVRIKFLHFGLSFMERDKLLCALCLIKSSPTLTILTLENEGFRFRSFATDFLGLKDYSGFKLDNLEELGSKEMDPSVFKLDHLEEFGMLNFSNLAIEMDFLKLVMASSPKLKRGGIELINDISVDQELKILKDPFPRASPSVKFIVTRRDSFLLPKLLLSNRDFINCLPE